MDSVIKHVLLIVYCHHERGKGKEEKGKGKLEIEVLCETLFVSIPQLP